VLHGAVDIRIHARVVEGTGDERHRDRTCPATADRAFVHLDLRSVVCLKSGETAIAIAGLDPGRLPLATSRHLEAARDSLTNGCAARILGDGDWWVSTDQAIGRVKDRSRTVLDD
jgi:hypothetical protein